MEIEIVTQEGIKQNIKAVEQTVEENGITVRLKLYELTDNSGSSLGEVAFHEDDWYEWMYIGTQLSDEEQDQIVDQIQAYETNVS